MRFVRRLAVVLATTALLGVGLAAPAFATLEGSFVSKINAERAANGLGALEWYWDLADDAEAHSGRMMNQQNLHHNPNLGSVTTGWQSLGENVGVGPSVDVLHEAFMNSSGHRANILGNYNYVGVGVKKESDSKMWVTVVFMKAPAGLNDPEPEPEPEPAPAPAPPPAPEPAPAPAPEPAPAPPSDPSPAPSTEPSPKATTAEPVAAPAVESATAATEPVPRYGRASLARPFCI